MSDRRYFNRDFSWLEFNRRVLAQARDNRHPLLERLKFLSIFSSNLDEFFMKRIGFLKRSIAQKIQTVGADRVSPAVILPHLRPVVEELLRERQRIHEEELLPELRNQNIELVRWNELSEEDRVFATEYFHKKVFPVLTPLAVDPAHPFPFLSNLSVSIGVKLSNPSDRKSLFARIKIPDAIPQWVRLPSPPGISRFIRVEEIISRNLSNLFPNMDIENVSSFRVTRNADVELVKDEAEDMFDFVEEALRRRRFAEVVRLEVSPDMDPWILDLLMEELELEDNDVYVSGGELFYGTLGEIAQLDFPALQSKPWSPATPRDFQEEGADLFRTLKDKDILVHHPFDSFSASVEKLIRTAASDPQVLAIKITLYRTGDNSVLIPLLIEAAERGKQVVCVVELKARFDEARNMHWGELLENAGVHVVYGVVGPKTHAKMALIVRREADSFRFYGHVGTGNYNANTSRHYTDFGLFTCNPAITNEMIEVFNYLTGLSLKRNYQTLLVSPINMRESFVKLIEQEIANQKAGLPARIIAKMNSLEDQQICDLLYEASAAGVEVDLIVRGFCCIRPGVPGLSENIRVKSIIGRFLEHTRLFYFRAGSDKPEQGQFYMGSADWMYRNLNNRVEVIVPLLNDRIRTECWTLLNLLLADHAQSWILRPDGRYELSYSQPSDSGIHEILMSRTRERTQPPSKEHEPQTLSH